MTYGYYDGHVDWMPSTDVSAKTQAAASHINYAPTLLTQPAAKFPSLLAGKGQLTVKPTPVVLNCPIVKMSKSRNRLFVIR